MIQIMKKILLAFFSIIFLLSFPTVGSPFNDSFNNWTFNADNESSNGLWKRVGYQSGPATNPIYLKELYSKKTAKTNPLQLFLPSDETLAELGETSTNRGAQIDSKNTYYYGKYRAEIRFAQKSDSINNGVVNGFFTFKGIVPDGFPKNEIDIEYYSNDNSIHFTVHGRNTTEKCGVLTDSDLADFDLSGTYYEYGFDWYSFGVVFYFNGQPICSTPLNPPDNTPNIPSYIIFNNWNNGVVSGQGPLINANMYVRKVTYTPLTDTTPPAVTIQNPMTTGIYTTTSNSITIAGVASDNAGVAQVTWSNDRSGSGTAVANSSWTIWSVSNIALQAGTNVITVIAEDADGNIGLDFLTVNYDTGTSPGECSAYEPNDDDYDAWGPLTSGLGYSARICPPDTNDPASDEDWYYFQTTSIGEIDIYLEGISGVNLRFFFSGSTGYIDEGDTGEDESYTYTGMATGIYQILVRACKSSSCGINNSEDYTLTYTFTPDILPPTVIITSPTSEDTYIINSSSINISGSASDTGGISQVLWSNDRGGSGTASGTMNWSVNGITLQSGTNVITVTASDTAGNTGTGTLTAIYVSDTVPPLPSPALNLTILSK